MPKLASPNFMHYKYATSKHEADYVIFFGRRQDIWGVWRSNEVDPALVLFPMAEKIYPVSRKIGAVYGVVCII